MTTHLVIPDTQVAPGAPIDHCDWIGRYILQIKPEVVVHLGDHWDMPSLSTYDEDTVEMEGRRLQDDIESGNRAIRKFTAPAKDYHSRKVSYKCKGYKPRWVFCLGNHEQRILRYVSSNPKLQGFLGYHSLYLDDWEVHDFLHPVEIDGVWYCHYFLNPANGRAVSGMMETRLKTVGFSFTQGHQQGRKVGERELANGQSVRGLVVGSCYLHDMGYRGPQACSEWRGIIVKHEVRNGTYDLMEVSLDFLCRKYEQMPLRRFIDEKYPEAA